MKNKRLIIWILGLILLVPISFVLVKAIINTKYLKLNYELIAQFTYSDIYNYHLAYNKLPNSVSDLRKFYLKEAIGQPFDFAPELDTSKIYFLESDTSIAVLYQISSNSDLNESKMVRADTLSFIDLFSIDYIIICHGPLDFEM